MAQDLENVIESITNKADHADFIWDLLLAYGISKTTITKAKKETADLFGGQNQIILKKKVLFERVDCCQNVLNRLDELQKDKNSYAKDPRFIIVTDFKDIAAYDTKTKEAPLAIPFKDLYRHSEFFLPWSGREKYEAHLENPADVKAAEKMARIYDEIYSHNKEFSANNNHALNVFLVRLLFCFFAEDTGIFDGENMFTEALTNHTKDDGSDLSQFFETLYESLDKRDKSRYPSYIQQFPYVNGHLFADKFPIPTLTAKVRRLILECGDQNWKEINPDIFGSMFQAVKDSKDRSGLGQHYTSVPNIMKVINPLFMDSLRKDFQDAYNNTKKLQKLQVRLSKIRIFDPACGSGNFLVIALKQLKLFEMDILQRMVDLHKSGLLKMNLSVIQLKQFYGIEIDDFACEIARLSLWLAEHQMNCKFKEVFGVTRPTLPLTESGHIKCGNACRLDWEEVCPKYIQRTAKDEFAHSDLQNTPMKLDIPQEEAEIYLLGNPPFDGVAESNSSIKQDIKHVFSHVANHNFDYVACWFYKASLYIQNTRLKYAFVATNSISQGIHASNFWPIIFALNQEIIFGYTSFPWKNNAKNNAKVICVIIGVSGIGNCEQKIIFSGNSSLYASHIDAYLTSAEPMNISQTSKPIQQRPCASRVGFIDKSSDFIISEEEYRKITSAIPKIKKFFRRMIGSQELLQGIVRYCLYITENNLAEALSYGYIRTICDKVKKLRQTETLYYRFCTREIPSNVPVIVIPRVCSFNRVYIPVEYMAGDFAFNDAVLVVDNPDIVLFALLTSKMHMVWVKKFAGRLKNDYRYSSTLVYNTFPFPTLNREQRKKISFYANHVIEIRQKYYGKALADLYDPDKMPKDLAEAHHNLDLCIESCYRKKPFENDDQRLKYLFKMYELISSGAKDEDLKQLELL